MAIRFKCKKCGEYIYIKYLKQGEIAKCKNCGEENLVPQNEFVEKIQGKEIPVKEKKPKYIIQIFHKKGYSTFDIPLHFDINRFKEKLINNRFKIIAEKDNYIRYKRRNFPLNPNTEVEILKLKESNKISVSLVTPFTIRIISLILYASMAILWFLIGIKQGYIGVGIYLFLSIIYIAEGILFFIVERINISTNLFLLDPRMKWSKKIKKFLNEVYNVLLMEDKR